jgi:putative phosphoribosyl transferase
MFGPNPIFADRHDAGRQLAVALRGYARENPLILALPRGGVPVGYEVARELGAPLDLVFVRKIGAPGQLELGLGAVVDGNDPQIVVNEDVIREVRPPPGYIEAEARRQLDEIERRRQLYRGGRPAEPVANRTVIVVDDGIATGGTVRAVLRALARLGPRRRILAVPVAPRESIQALRAEADDVVCLATPEPFYAVGTHYDDFVQTEDREVIELLDLARGIARGELSP